LIRGREDMLITTMYDMGLAIRQRREVLGLSQEQLALRSGVSRSWLAKVETGKMSFDLRRVLMVLDTLELHLEVANA
jgi:HTH-type transcriptional regulator/antitoxin HipB